jgi:hypothetical protein
MVDIARPKFSLGRVVATPGALDALQRAGQSPDEFLRRHLKGDWGDLGTDDQTLNDEALLNGSRIFSAYRTSIGDKLWVITQAADESGPRSATTLLMPDEY